MTMTTPNQVQQPETRGKLAWGIMSVFILLLASVIFGVPLIALNLSENITAGLIFTVLIELGSIVFILWRNKNLKNWKNALRVKIPEKKRFFAIGAFLGLFTFLFLQALSVLFSTMGLEVGSSDTSSRIAAVGGYERFIILFLLTPIIVPFVEELFFRGLVFGFIRDGLRKFEKFQGKRGFITAAIISSVYFSMMHFQGAATFSDFFILVYIFLIALVNAYLTEKSKSILPGYVMHLIYNGLTVLAIVLATSV